MAARRGTRQTPHWGRRIAWLLAIWILSVGAMAVIAFAIKGIMRLAGFGI